MWTGVQQLMALLKPKKPEKTVSPDLPVDSQPDGPLHSLKLSYSEILLAADSFSSKFVITDDGLGTLYKGTLPNGMKVAVQRYGRGCQESQVKEFEARVKSLSQIRHPNLLPLIGFCSDMSKMISVHEYMEDGSLAQHLRPLSTGHFDRFPPQPELSWERRLRICINAAEGLHHLHTDLSLGFIHGDVTSFNIFLGRDYAAKLADFGVSKSVYFANDYRPKLLTIHYLDPLYYTKKPHVYFLGRMTKKSDVYSFGVVLIEVLCGKLGSTRITEGEKNWTLEQWAILCLHRSELEKMIDPCLIGKINPESLRIFAGTVKNCLRSRRSRRPLMRDVLWSLELALEVQLTATPAD